MCSIFVVVALGSIPICWTHQSAGGTKVDNHGKTKTMNSFENQFCGHSSVAKVLLSLVSFPLFDAEDGGCHPAFDEKQTAKTHGGSEKLVQSKSEVKTQTFSVQNELCK